MLLDLIAGPLLVADRNVTKQRSDGRLSSKVCRAYLPCHYRSHRPGRLVSRRAPPATQPLAAAVPGAAAAAVGAGVGGVDAMEQ